MSIKNLHKNEKSFLAFDSTFLKIKQALDMKGASYAKIAEKMGIERQSLRAYKEKGYFPASRIVKFCLTYKLPIENFMSSGEKTEAPIGTTQNGDFAYIPAVRGKIGAGGGLEPDNAVEMKIAFRKDWVTRHGDPGKMSLIRVQGDSMEPTLQSGDWVLIDHQRNYIDMHGGIYAVAVNGVVIIKRVQMNARTKKMKVISDNKDYEPIEFEETEITVNGKMIWFCREVER